MCCEANDGFWRDLLSSIDERAVIPVIGEGVVTVGQPPQRLTDWLATQLADSLGITPNRLPAQPSLNDVVAAHRLSGETGQKVYNRIKQLLAEDPPSPQTPLLDLARITHFNLFLTTTFDPLLKDALNAVRHGGAPLTRLIAFNPRAKEKDLPAPKADLDTTLYHVLGQVSGKPDYAVWDEDVLEFVLELHRLLLSSDARHLGAALQENHLLFIGCNFSDWLARFFIRVAEQFQFSDTSRKKMRIVADGPTPLDQRLVMFFNSTTRDTHLIACDPVAFATELHQRWAAQFPHSVRLAEAAQSPFLWPEKAMPPGAVFISYPSADIEAAKRLKQGLQEAGCPVWFDLERLQAGENWDNTLKEEVKNKCALFVSVISQNSERRPGYWVKERSWASERAEEFGNLAGFYLPVFVDDTKRGALRLEPLPKVEPNFTWLPGGGVTPEFAARVNELRARNLSFPRR